MNANIKADTWWLSHPNLVLLVDYLAEVGWGGREIAEVVRKPWQYSEEFTAARTGAPIELEPGL